MKQESLHAAFMMEGLHNAGYAEVIAAWNQGCIEMVSEMVVHASFLATLAAAIDAITNYSRPGVLEYEVSSPFGTWFGRYILEHGTTPPNAEAQKWILNNVVIFYSQNPTLHGEVDAIKAVALKSSADFTKHR